MSDHCCRIERAANGYEVEITDPKIVKANRERKDGMGGWRSPTVTFVFEDIEGVLTFLKDNLDKALVQDDFSTTFALASAEKDD